MSIQKDIEQMVKSAGFDYAKLIGEWSGCDVYRLMLNDHSLKTGIPVMILVDRNGSCRFSDLDETFEIYDAIYV